MPFGCSDGQFVRNYSSGDIFYGLAEPRAALAASLGIPAASTWTIDQYDTMAEQRNVGQWVGYRHDPEFNELLAGRTDGASYNFDTKSDELWGEFPVENSAVARRKCKTGLKYLATRTSPPNIHFCLAGLNLDRVGEKNLTGFGVSSDVPAGNAKRTGVLWAAKTRSITGAELRFIMRNRDKRKFQNVIQFWNAQPLFDPDGDVIMQDGYSGSASDEDVEMPDYPPLQIPDTNPWKRARWFPCAAPWDEPAANPGLMNYLTRG